MVNKIKMPNNTRPDANILDFFAERELLLDPVNSDFGHFVREAVKLYHCHPEIETRIAADQRSAALAAKHKRARERNDDKLRTQPLFESDDADLVACSLDLKSGRPRMHPLPTFIFVLLRGRLGGPCRASFQDLVLESRSLSAALAPYMSKLPGQTTILENINLLSDETLETIHRLQLADALKDGLDDFERIAVDSTSVKASSAWPTDSKTIVDLCRRFLSTEAQLQHFGYEPASTRKCKDWLEKMDRLHKAISMRGSGQKAEKKLRRYYRDFFIVTCKLLERLLKRHQSHLSWLQQTNHPPLRSEKTQLLVQTLGEDLSSATRTLHQSIDRVENGCPPKTRERILGVADRAAAIIVKGGREPVMGYKPQLARSGQGLITAIRVESGNPADSANLEPLVRATINATTIVPNAVSVDDGYSSQVEVGKTKDLGVEKVSVSGAKGKRLQGEEWDDPFMSDLRKWRSSIESAIYMLKHSSRFGCLGRRGLAAVRRELTEKILAYNLDRLLLLRKRQQEDQAA